MGLFSSFDRLQPEVTDNTTISNLFLSKESRFDLLCTTIKNIDNKTDDEIKYLIYQEHNTILNYDLFMLHNDTRKITQNLFKNIRFLKLFLSVINYVPLNRHEIICLNKLAYDYYLLEDINKDEEVRDLLLTISYEINKKQVIQLSAILGINKARLLALIGNSSFKEEKCIRRVCLYLVKLSNYPEVEFNIQYVVDILLIFINVHFTNVFISIMTETKSPTLNEKEEEIFNMITNAVFQILESMTSNDIYKVLVEYANYLLLMNVYKVRTPIRYISHSDRVSNIIKEIESMYEIKAIW